MNSTAEVTQTIAAAEARDKCKGIADVEERLKAAMRATKDHWMETTEMGQLRAAIAAAMIESPPDDRDRILRSFKAMNELNNALAAATSGVPVAWDEIPQADPDVLPIIKWWKEIAP